LSKVIQKKRKKKPGKVPLPEVEGGQIIQSSGGINKTKHPPWVVKRRGGKNRG